MKVGLGGTVSKSLDWRGELQEWANGRLGKEVEWGARSCQAEEFRIDSQGVEGHGIF